MAVYTFATLADFYLLQDRLSENAIAFGELNSSATPMTFTVPAAYDAEVVASQANILAGVPAPVVDPVALASAISDLNTSITTGISPSILAIQNDVASIIANQQTMSYSYAEIAVPKRQWAVVAGIPAITITASQAGTWVFSASAHSPVNGQAIGVRASVNGVHMFEQSIDGSGRLGDSVVTASMVQAVVAGDVITVEISHDIENTSDINGEFRAAKLF